MDNPNKEPLFDVSKEDHYPKRFTVPEIIQAISSDLSDTVVLPAGVVYGMSDLTGDLLEEFKASWPQIPIENRRKTIRFLAEACETNFDLTFRSVADVAFDDEDADIRAAATDLAWYDTSTDLYYRLMRLADDVAPVVRAKAMVHLGRFVYEAEMDEFDAQLAERVKDLAADRFYDYTEDLEVRRRSLEALSRGSHPSLNDMIMDAYDSPEFLMRVSAVFAMGSSCDTKRWGDIVLRELDSEYPELRFEAARASGELVLEDAVPHLIALASESDVDIRINAVVALGEIGTHEARRGLMNLAEDASEREDDIFLETIEEALEMASLMGGLVIPMFDFDEDDLDEDDPLGMFGDDEDSED